MKILFVSETDLKSNLGSSTRILKILQGLIRAYGSESIDWINLVPGNLNIVRTIRICRDLQARQRQLGISTLFLPQVGMPLARLMVTLLLSLILLALLCWRYRKGKPSVIWSEMTLSAIPFLHYKRLFSVPLIVDMHGTSDERIQFFPRNRRTALGYARRVFEETEVLWETEGLVAVSSGMLTYYSQRYAFLPRFTKVIPCFADTAMFSWSEKERHSARQELGVEGRFVFIYSGGSQSWQCIDEMLAFFDTVVRTESFKPLKPLFIALIWDHKAHIEKRLRQLGIPREAVSIMSVPQTSVVRYLQAADAGFLFRTNASTNLVSCPTKAAEYLCAGLPMICTPYVGDIPNLVSTLDLGYVTEIPGPKDVEGFRCWCERVMRQRLSLALRCSEAGKRYFGSESLLLIADLLAQVAKKKNP